MAPVVPAQTRPAQASRQPTASRRNTAQNAEDTEKDQQQPSNTKQLRAQRRQRREEEERKEVKADVMASQADTAAIQDEKEKTE